MTCDAETSGSRGAGHALWADISLSCTVTRPGHPSHLIILHGQHMVTPHELDSHQLADAQHRSDTDALLRAIDQLDCTQLHGAPLGTQNPQ